MAGFCLSRTAYDRMTLRASEDYPEETCGFVFGDDDALEVVPMRNVQNDLHAQNPAVYERDARTAYFFDPVETQRVLEEKEAAGVPFRAIYHSHPDHDAYFSETDSAAAAPFGEPCYPGVVHLVFSVRKAVVADAKAFDWSESASRYVEVPLSVE